ncbi:MAG: WecB/TagA/CpsF family glycosyltransferase [Prevotella sp.]|nr:WecB/TagA/CpsF family glycosyltransferase [Prevotella sp.]
MLKLKDIRILESKEDLRNLPEGKLLINTINAHSYNVAQKDVLFAEALQKGDVLIPDGASIVMACKWLEAKSQPKERIAGWDLFVYEMERVNGMAVNDELGIRNYDVNENENVNGNEDDNGNDGVSRGRKKRVMFMGSSEAVLEKIRQEASYAFHNIEVITYSPPYKPVFTDEDNAAMISAINRAKPDLLWIGMTAPKQEKWAYEHWQELEIDCHVGTVGAVFDFFAGMVKRAPLWWQRHGLEWLYRLLKEPKRMWRRYLVGNVLFLWNVWKEK